MATVNLGAIKFNWKGAYNSGTAYVVDDVVSSGGNSYICVASSIGNAVSDTAYWAVMAQAGTNGTDLTSTLTAQGDVLYRDGSGLQRLAKGTAGQALKMNSGATAPEWGTDQGGAWNLIGTGTASNSASLDITGLSATYTTYALIMSNIRPVSNGGWLYIRIGDSNGFASGGGTYEFHNVTVKTNSGSYSGRAGADTQFYVCEDIGNATEKSGNATIYLNCRGATERPSFHGTSQCMNAGGDGMGGSLMGEYAYAMANLDRVQCFMNSGNIASGTFSVYGISKT
tara:strand:+ start:2848 stop:3699 length:852 start_codon:yes stop_codon:yes gene_type:complete